MHFGLGIHYYSVSTFFEIAVYGIIDIMQSENNAGCGIE